MSRQFDDLPLPSNAFATAAAPGSPVEGDVSVVIARAYVSADPRVKARMLECLTRPLGVLSLLGVGAGAFAQLLALRVGSGSLSAIDVGARFTGEQIVELVRFVEQVSPQALNQCLALLSFLR
jgi:hypothetical protein